MFGRPIRIFFGTIFPYVCMFRPGDYISDYNLSTLISSNRLLAIAEGPGPNNTKWIISMALGFEPQPSHWFSEKASHIYLKVTRDRNRKSKLSWKNCGAVTQQVFSLQVLKKYAEPVEIWQVWLKQWETERRWLSPRFHRSINLTAALKTFSDYCCFFRDGFKPEPGFTEFWVSCVLDFLATLEFVALVELESSDF